jgi:hypothetical protein
MHQAEHVSGIDQATMARCSCRPTVPFGSIRKPASLQPERGVEPEQLSLVQVATLFPDARMLHLPALFQTSLLAVI